MFINVVLSGDNAVVIALACRSLSPRHRRQAFIWGSAGIVVLMALLTTFIVYLLSIPYVQIVGSALLLWIGIKLLIAEDEEHENVQESSTLMAAIKTIIIADFIMSLDNVLAMAGAARGHVWMLVFGLIITIPVVLFGSALLMKIMHRFPITIILGAALIGYVAGKMMVTDPSIMEWVEARAPSLHVIAPIIGAIFVVGAGKLIEHLKSRRRRAAVGSGEAAARQSDY
jgi:YjbE family integral membrane protein